MDDKHNPQPCPVGSTPFWRSRYGLGLLVFGAIAAYFLLTEQRADFLGALPFLLILSGFLLQWPTLLTLAMFPILLVMYGRLALTEEAQMRTRFGDAFERYARQTPRFFPRMGQGSTAG